MVLIPPSTSPQHRREYVADDDPNDQREEEHDDPGYAEFPEEELEGNDLRVLEEEDETEHDEKVRGMNIVAMMARTFITSFILLLTLER